MKDNEIVAQQWFLKPQYTSVVKYHQDTNGNFIDIDKTERNFVVIGTRDQTSKLFMDMLEKYAWQLRDSFEIPVRERWLELYRKNNNKATLLNLI